MKRPSLLELPRAVWLLAWVSLATDAANEAIYPLLPFFVTQIVGAGALTLGIVEGTAEAASSILKIASGRMADHVRSKRLLVLVGYGLASAVRPFIAIARSWRQVLGIRVIDRIGKGLRTAPRDAMLATWATPHNAEECTVSTRAWTTLAPSLAPALLRSSSFFSKQLPYALRLHDNPRRNRCDATCFCSQERRV